MTFLLSFEMLAWLELVRSVCQEGAASQSYFQLDCLRFFVCLLHFFLRLLLSCTWNLFFNDYTEYSFFFGGGEVVVFNVLEQNLLLYNP